MFDADLMDFHIYSNSNVNVNVNSKNVETEQRCSAYLNVVS